MDGAKVRIGAYQQTCVFVDRIYINSKHVAVDTVFSSDCVKISLVARDGCSEDDIDAIKDSFGAAWPFSDERDERIERYIYVIDSPFGEDAILSYLKRVFTAFGVLSA